MKILKFFLPTKSFIHTWFFFFSVIAGVSIVVVSIAFILLLLSNFGLIYGILGCVVFIAGLTAFAAWLITKTDFDYDR